MAATVHNPRYRTWSRASRGLRRELSAVIPVAELRGLHRKRSWRHVLVTARQATILALASWSLWALSDPLLWGPLVLLQGLVIFDSTVLLHEVLHRLVWQKRHPRAGRLPALATAVETV